MFWYLQLPYFNSHPHEEDDGTVESAGTNKANFNSHPHEEDDNRQPNRCIRKIYFNSHPHEEDDMSKHWNIIEVCNISTHILTKRMTNSTPWTITWKNYFNSHPHEEDDKKSVESHISEAVFQLTSSRRGWRCTFIPFRLCKFISTHILTKRMTVASFNFRSW